MERPASRLRIRSRGSALALALIGLLLAAPASPAPPRASDGTRLLEAAETSGSAVVGRVGAPRALDGSGWLAPLRIETVLLGPTVGESIELAWEELAASRAPRFREAERVLVVLAPVPSGSLWSKRVGSPALRQRTRVVADRSRAFVREPSLGATNRLRHYWALSQTERRGATGLGHLASLIGSAEPPLATSAAHALASSSAGGELIDSGSARDLVLGLLRDDVPSALRDALLGWIGGARPPALRAELERRLTPPDAPAVLHLALARLEGELAAEHSEALLASADPELRQVGAAHAGPEQLGVLRGILAQDPIARVRVAAVRRAAAIGDEPGFEAALDAFDDAEPTVRAAAADATSRSAAFDAIRLRGIAFGWPRPAPETAVLALRLHASGASRAVLEEIAASHEDAGLRTLAQIALGRDPQAH